jgi:hypothetical protein
VQKLIEDEHVQLRYSAPLRSQGLLAEDHWSYARIQRAAMQFDFRFASSLTVVGFLALAGSSAPFNNEMWKAVSLRYMYQFTLGLKDEFNHLKDWRRLGLKKARRITLEDHLEMSARPEERVTRLRKLRENVAEKSPAIVIQIRVEREDGVLYCMPNSYIHGIGGLRPDVSGISID